MREGVVEEFDELLLLTFVELTLLMLSYVERALEVDAEDAEL